eukprot:Blabericola_migrator_1__567@NODE_1140_length_5303_cov_96_490451_g776_i0_p2_GENE_NODE_1140_length_5303_cov_96_490451_g776_i0NODE_1140_length_5303_cov_96_490451_g776_i0_p2_ORF_typecomplete_len271_score38_96TEX13/PF15186_6/8_2e02TEX13/PF15186_6/0_15_NODE_1140_length_5303_cov_96_490451_g776_i041504962
MRARPLHGMESPPQSRILQDALGETQCDTVPPVAYTLGPRSTPLTDIFCEWVCRGHQHVPIYASVIEKGFDRYDLQGELGYVNGDLAFVRGQLLLVDGQLTVRRGRLAQRYAPVIQRKRKLASEAEDIRARKVAFHQRRLNQRQQTEEADFINDNILDMQDEQAEARQLLTVDHRSPRLITLMGILEEGLTLLQDTLKLHTATCAVLKEEVPLQREAKEISKRACAMQRKRQKSELKWLRRQRRDLLERLDFLVEMLPAWEEAELHAAED